jgi:hypothetical protein
LKLIEAPYMIGDEDFGGLLHQRAPSSETAMQHFRQDIARFVRGGDVATLLRILPEDPWQGLVRFELTGETRWINAALMAQVGWTPLITN